MTALGCIAYRKGDRTKAWEEFDAAAGAESKEAIIYAVWAVLAVRAGERERALKALAKGLEAVPESDFLRGLQKTVQNKKKIQTKKFPESWFQFFPEDMMKQHMTRGRRDGGGPVQQAMRQQLGAKPGAKAIHRMR